MDEDVRVGEADRARVISALERHCRAGRLDMDELLERSAAAYGARTRAELAVLTGDLPDETGNADVSRKRGWRDPAWRLHLTLAVLVNAAVSGLWVVTRDRTPSPTDEGAGYWWPLWLALISGILVLLHYLHEAGRLTLPAPPHRPVAAAADAGTVPPATTDHPAPRRPGVDGSRRTVCARRGRRGQAARPLIDVRRSPQNIQRNHAGGRGWSGGTL